MAICQYCSQDMLRLETVSCFANTTVKFANGTVLPPVPYSSDSGRRCHDCNIAPGGYHHPGCDMERCPACKGQLISCNCNPRTDLGKKILRISADQAKSILAAHMQAAQEMYEHRDYEMFPILFVFVARDNDKSMLHMVPLLSFAENRYASLSRAGQQFGEQKAVVSYIILLTEGWMATQKACEDKIPPSADPDRIEVLSISLQTLDQQTYSSIAVIDRTGEKIAFSPVEFDSVTSNLLNAFYQAYAESMISSLRKVKHEA